MDYERAFIKSLEHRIISLEKQLDDKQAIINKLLAEGSTLLNPNTLDLHGSCTTITKDNGTHSADSKNTKPLAPPSKDSSGLPKQVEFHTTPSINSKENKENKAIETNAIDQGEEYRATNNRSHSSRNVNLKAVKKRKTAQTTVARNNTTTESAKEVNSEINRRKRNELQDIEKRKVLIVGDSQLRKISGDKLTKYHHSVNVEAMPGAKISKMKEVNIDEDVNVVIIHAGTCNIRKQTNPEKLADEIVSTLKEVKEKLPKAQIAFSSILKRNDDMELNARVLKTNQLLQEKLLFSGLDYIDNDNIRYGNISVDGLHINEGGVKILASNFSKYVRYC